MPNLAFGVETVTCHTHGRQTGRDATHRTRFRIKSPPPQCTYRLVNIITSPRGWQYLTHPSPEQPRPCSGERESCWVTFPESPAFESEAPLSVKVHHRSTLFSFFFWLHKPVSPSRAPAAPLTQWPHRVWDFDQFCFGMCPRGLGIPVSNTAPGATVIPP